jgi:RNA polymerase sigma factor (sigma-70 family)
MDTPIGDDSDFTLADTFQSSDFADTEIIQSDILQKINTALNSLTERERFIIINLFGIGVNEMTLVEISNKLDLTSERVRQIKNTAIKKLSKSGVLSSLV